MVLVQINEVCLLELLTRVDDNLLKDLLSELFVCDVLVMLGGDNNCVDTDRIQFPKRVFIILHCDLGLTIRPEERQLATLPGLRQVPGKIVC